MCAANPHWCLQRRAPAYGVLPRHPQRDFILPGRFRAGLTCVNFTGCEAPILRAMLGVIAAPGSAFRHAGKADRRGEDTVNMRSRQERGNAMSTFVMVTRVDPAALRSPQSLEGLEHQVSESIRMQCPKVKWKASYAVLGPYDYVDIFDAPDIETAAKVSTLVRTSGRAHSEIWAATEWSKFKRMVHAMPKGRGQ